MKRAVLYARVSSDLQKKEKTVDSQVAELKKQIKKAGDVLVKEYIEEGFTGANLDRPALNELRSDLKKGIFDIIYILFVDRISREVSKLHIFLTEVLIYKKEIVINGKNYINDPSNKFEMTILGAVAELERAKIIERNNRGRQYHLRQGHILSNGCNIFGYTYFRRSVGHYAHYEINEHEAEIVRTIFDIYAKGNHSGRSIARDLETRGIKNERVELSGGAIMRILSHEAYTGIRYFNTKTSESALGLAEYNSKKHKIVPTDRSHWIGIKIPAIISKELFNKVAKQIKYNRTIFRNAKGTQLLSNLMVCGKCQGRCYSCRKAYFAQRVRGTIFCDKRFYRCKGKGDNHNPEIDTRVLESCVTGMIRDNLFDERKIKDYMDFFKKQAKDSKITEKQLKEIKEKTTSITNQKERIVDLYAKSGIDPTEYFKRVMSYENELNELEDRRKELLGRLPLLKKPELVETSIAEYSKEIKKRFESCNDFSSWRQFFLDFVTKVEYTRNVKTDHRIRLYGSIPVKIQDDIEKSVEFKIERMISKEEISERIRQADLHKSTIKYKSITHVESGRLKIRKVELV